MGLLREFAIGVDVADKIVGERCRKLASGDSSNTPQHDPMHKGDEAF
jgi:hypothetical protein